MKRIKYLIIIPIFLLLFSCQDDAGRKDSLSIVSYNLYLLFDAEKDGDEYYPFSDKKIYSAEEYKERIKKYQEFFLSSDGEADIYILSEVESEQVLKDLMSGRMSRKGYKYYAISNSDSPISVSIISRYKIENIRLHSNDGPRSIIEAELFFNGEKVSIFALHAKSRLDGGEGERESTFEHLSTLMENSYPSLAIAAGDFNEDPRFGPYFLSSSYALDAPLLASGEVSDLDYEIFYAPSLSSDDMMSYYYEGSWYAYDHILLNAAAFDGIGLEHENSLIVYPPDALDSEMVPIKYDPESGAGYSDHLAVKTLLRYY